MDYQIHGSLYHLAGPIDPLYDCTTVEVLADAFLNLGMEKRNGCCRRFPRRSRRGGATP